MPSAFSCVGFAWTVEKHVLQRVERARPDIAEDDTQRGDCKGRDLLLTHRRRPYPHMALPCAPGGESGRAESKPGVHTRNVLGGAIFSLAAAVTGTALVDPMVEWIANKGFFGSGNFTDHSNLNVVPALIIGFAFAVAFVLALVRRTMNLSARYAPDWLRRFADANRSRTALRLLPAIFVLQILVLWSMENARTTRRCRPAVGRHDLARRTAFPRVCCSTPSGASA